MRSSAAGFFHTDALPTQRLAREVAYMYDHDPTQVPFVITTDMAERDRFRVQMAAHRPDVRFCLHHIDHGDGITGRVIGGFVEHLDEAVRDRGCLPRVLVFRDNVHPALIALTRAFVMHRLGRDVPVARLDVHELAYMAALPDDTSRLCYTLSIAMRCA